MQIKDTYNTIIKPSEEVLFKDKNSKFFGYAFPVKIEEDLKQHLDELKKQHHTARHWCYAYQIGTEKETIKMESQAIAQDNLFMVKYNLMKLQMY